MTSPFTRLNTARIRAERRATARRRMAEAACLALIALISVVIGDMILTTALALDDLTAQALAAKGM